MPITRTKNLEPGTRNFAKQGEHGFTLLELVMVMALLVLMMGLVAPTMYGTWHREREKASLRQLMTTLRSARSLAASRHQRVRVFLDLSAGRYRLEGTSKGGELSRSMRVGEAHLVWQDREGRRGYIAFYGDGSSSGGYLVLTDKGGVSQVIDVEIITGKVSLKPAKS
ncbi:MAG: prepilin-type N-terminal cleavage/methylation domain-containing protein [Deltaproteobacteria bacterium]|nr:MAG: prepilin-type N-terminal cleavage/methylation domain-containing protein [Deltaproteobacteria bacterium]